MDRRKEVIGRLRDLEQLRCAVQGLEQAMQVLSPEERLVVDRLLVCPGKGNVQVLCELLGVEQATVYRRRDRALKKLEKALFGERIATPVCALPRNDRGLGEVRREGAEALSYEGCGRGFRSKNINFV